MSNSIKWILAVGIVACLVGAKAQADNEMGTATIKGRVVMDQLDIIEAEGGSANRFISIHTQAEPDFEMHKAVAGRGAWIEYDHVGRDPDAEVLALVLKALEAGLGGQLLLSHDRGFYDPAKRGGGVPEPYTHLNESLLPALRRAGLGEPEITRLTHDNPFNAFAR